VSGPVAGYTGVTADGSGFTGAAPVPPDPTAYAAPSTANARVAPGVLATAPVLDTPGPYDQVVVAEFDEGFTFVPRTNSADALDHSYELEWLLGPVTEDVRATSAMTMLREWPNDVFPFPVESTDGEPPRLRAGVRLNLRATQMPFDDNHIVVTETSATSVEFTAESDHFRGQGSRIQFRTEERDGRLYLIQNADEATSWLDSAYDVAAKVSWRAQADNLRTLLYGTGSRDQP
jgi:hypothetical protein